MKRKKSRWWNSLTLFFEKILGKKKMDGARSTEHGQDFIDSWSCLNKKISTPYPMAESLKNQNGRFKMAAVKKSGGYESTKKWSFES